MKICDEKLAINGNYYGYPLFPKYPKTYANLKTIALTKYPSAISLLNAVEAAGKVSPVQNTAFRCFLSLNSGTCIDKKYADSLIKCGQKYAKARVEKNKCTYDGTVYSIASLSLTSPLKIFLFGGNYNGFWRPQRFKCKYFKIWESDTLIMDLVPAKDLDGIVCMYDKVSLTYKYNSGSGTFTAGPEKTT